MFLYHRVPKRMIGSRLRPLSSLAELDTDLHRQHLATYQDHPSRYELPKRIIPKLGCRWQDVVMLAPVHPHLFVRAWADLGVQLPAGVRWFQVPASALEGLPAAVFHHRDDVATSDPIREDQVEWFDPRTYRELTTLPERTWAWYRQLAARNGVGSAFFHTLPHVMVKGDLDTVLASIITWDSPPQAEENQPSRSWTGSGHHHALDQDQDLRRGSGQAGAGDGQELQRS